MPWTEWREGRGNTRPSGAALPPTNTPGGMTGVPRGRVRIELIGDGYVTFTFANSIFTDLILEVRSELGNLTYYSESGRIFTVPNTFIWGDTILSSNVTWGVGRTYTRNVPANVFGQVEPHYVVGARTDVATPVPLPGDYVAPVIPPQQYQTTCQCEMCRRDREQYANIGVRRTDADVARYNQAIAQQRAATEAEIDAAEARAEKRAKETLRMVLLPDELAFYERTGKLIVTGADGQRYRIMSGIVDNVWLLGDDNDELALATLCCHPKMYPRGSAMLPLTDAFVGQILYLRYDLDRFWKTANVHWCDLRAKVNYLTRAQLDRHARRTRVGPPPRLESEL